MTVMTVMTPSVACFKLIEKHEGCKLQAYMPTPKDRPTIGWGSTGPDIHLGMAWTQSQCDARMYSDLNRFAYSISAMLGDAKTTQNQFDALVSFAYNEGAQRLHDSLILALHKQGKYAAAAEHFMHYTTQAGRVLGGLVDRRKEEMALYLKA